MKTYSYQKHFLFFEQIALIVILFLCIYYFNHRLKPSFNPFDEQFNLLMTDLTNEKCDTIMAGCGYFNLSKNIHGIEVYYQFFLYEGYSVAKGFELHLDTVTCNGNFIRHKLYDMPIDMDFIRRKIAFFKVKLQKIEKNKEYPYLVAFFQTTENKIIKGEIDIEVLEGNNCTFVRKLSVFRSNDKQSKTFLQFWRDYIDSFQKKRLF